MTARVCTVAIGAIVVASSLAAAGPVHVNADRCTQIDSTALDAAVMHELALDPKLVVRAQQLAVSLACPDGPHANVQIDPAPADGPLSRDVDLGEEPAELRVKLVALAIAELIDVSTTVAPSPPPSVAPDHPADDDNPPRIGAVAPHPHTIGPKIAARAGLRVFADDQYPMASMSVDLELGPVEVGLGAALGEGHRFTSIPYIVTVTLARRLVCSDGRTSLCMLVRGELGFAGVSIYEDSQAMMEHSVHSMYGDITAGLEVQHQFTGYKGLAGVEIGAADGLVVEALSFVHLNGPFATVGLGVQW